MRRTELADFVRTPSAVLLIALEFTNAVPFLAEGGKQPALTQHSRYPFQFVAYGLAAAVLLLDRQALKRLFHKPIIYWSLFVLVLYTWSMLVRAFNAPVGFSDYDVVRYFGLRVNAVGFLITCVIIFDSRHVLRLTRKTIVLVTLVGIAFNLYDFAVPGIFSNIPGRAGGLYVDSNCSGMALTFGGLLGLAVIRRQWMRESFLLCVLVGVLVTFSRQAMVSFVIVVTSASLARVLSFRRLAFVGLTSMALFVLLDLSTRIMGSNLLNPDTLARLTLQWPDASERDRVRLAEKTLEQFEIAPLIGQGFGTATYWTDQSQSHNAFLGFLADCGIVGALVIPAMILSLRRNNWEFFAFALVFLVWSLFYHDVLQEFFGLIVVGIEADERTKTASAACRDRFWFGARDDAHVYQSYSSSAS